MLNPENRLPLLDISFFKTFFDHLFQTFLYEHPTYFFERACKIRLWTCRMPLPLALHRFRNSNYYKAKGPANVKICRIFNILPKMSIQISGFPLSYNLVSTEYTFFFFLSVQESKWFSFFNQKNGMKESIADIFIKLRKIMKKYEIIQRF